MVNLERRLQLDGELSLEEADLDLARALDGIDVIVSGHSHVVTANNDPDAGGETDLFSVGVRHNF